MFFGIGEFYSRHHLRNSASFCIRGKFFYEPPRDNKTNRSNYEDHPRMPIENKMQEIFAPCKNLCIHHRHKTRNHRANPERNCLKQIILQLFVSDVIERFFKRSSDDDYYFQHLIVGSKIDDKNKEFIFLLKILLPVKHFVQKVL